MGINIPIEEIEKYQDDYLWDDIKDDIKTIIWDAGQEAWSDIDISDNEDEDQIIIKEILDFFELLDILN